MRRFHDQTDLADLVDVDDSGGLQIVGHYGLAGERHSKVYRPQAFGLSSRPPQGSTGLVVSLGGERSRSVFLGGEHEKYRPKGLADGETKLYDAEGNVIHFARKNGVKVTTAKGDTTIETPNGKVHITSDGHHYVYPKSGKVYLGSPDGSGCFPVATLGGPSKNVLAFVG